MLQTSCRNLLTLPPFAVSVTRLESGIPSVNDMKKSENDYHPSKYTILGNKRRDPMHYTDRKVGRGYWHFSNTIFHSRPKIHPKIAKGIKRNFYLIFAVLLGLCIDYDWLGYQIKKCTTYFRPEAVDYNLPHTKSMSRRHCSE
ncbi:hypothetical protein LOAG_02177 [Loa loa]|uniref:Uncharacterized protein n=1 Tax=Loa loa TaxID=7209 RepID=A0A1S0U7S2_LOALO|nr:hypothetical protein LOAG_02177 [Loa loa]EFO26305.2 hypothetical protein LOAG_02177 [Loa loa]